MNGLFYYWTAMLFWMKGLIYYCEELLLWINGLFNYLGGCYLYSDSFLSYADLGIGISRFKELIKEAFKYWFGRISLTTTEHDIIKIEPGY